jgi:hypothetical protein
MKTYKELEREAYITGNIELAKVYATLCAVIDVNDIDDYKDELDEVNAKLEEANAKLREIASIIEGY